MAGVKGLEPSTFCVTGRRSNQAELHPHACDEVFFIKKQSKLQAFFILFYQKSAKAQQMRHIDGQSNTSALSTKDPTDALFR